MHDYVTSSISSELYNLNCKLWKRGRITLLYTSKYKYDENVIISFDLVPKISILDSCEDHLVMLKPRYTTNSAFFFSSKVCKSYCIKLDLIVRLCECNSTLVLTCPSQKFIWQLSHDVSYICFRKRQNLLRQTINIINIVRYEILYRWTVIDLDFIWKMELHSASAILIRSPVTNWCYEVSQ